jgi:hypothetical protein
VLVHDALHEREAEPDASGAARDERLEDALVQLLGNAGPVVAHFEASEPALGGQQRELDRAALRERLYRVHEQVHRDLINQIGLARD